MAEDLPPGHAAMRIHDNEKAEITLSLPVLVTEGEGDTAYEGRVTLSHPPDTDLIISLASEKNSALALPRRLIIPAGQSSATFSLGAVENNLHEGERVLCVTASVSGWKPAVKNVTRRDNEEFRLTMTLPQTLTEGQGRVENAGTVSVPGVVTADLAVQLSVDGCQEISLPPFVTIPSGQSTIAFDIIAASNSVAEGNQVARVTASTAGWISAAGSVEVFENWREGEEKVAFSASDYLVESNLAALRDGGFVVAWESWSSSSFAEFVWLQRFDGAGKKVGDAMAVTSPTTDRQQVPVVAGLQDGGFVVAWSSISRDDNRASGIYAQRFDKSGSPLGEPLTVNVNPNFSVRKKPLLAAFPDGGFVVGWQSYDPSTYGEKLYVRLFNGQGQPVGAIQETTSQVWQSGKSTIVVLSEGDFLLLWEGGGAVSEGLSILGQRFDRQGGTKGPELQINPFNGECSSDPVAVGMMDGGFAIGCKGNLPEKGGGIILWRYDRDGVNIGQSVKGIGYESLTYPYKYDMIALDDGGLLLTWTAYPYVLARRVSAVGEAREKPFIVNASNTPLWEERGPTAASLTTGKFAVAWNSLATNPGFTDTIFVQIHSFDRDRDDDGIADTLEDADHDGEVDPGETDPRSADTDGDGIQDGTELGLTLADITNDTDPAKFVLDLDPSTTTSPVCRDSDQDGLADGEEDANRNGRLDPGESDPDLMALDANHNRAIDLGDLGVILGVLSGKVHDDKQINPKAGMDANKRIGLVEALAILRQMAQTAK